MASESQENLNQTAGSSTEQPDEFLRLRRSRSAAKANVTKKIKEITEWKINCQSLDDARSKIKEFSDVANKFYGAHEAYHATIDNEYDIMDSDEYLQAEMKRIENFNRTLEEWVLNFTSTGLKADQEITPNDSASNTENGLYVKTRSSVTSARSKANSST